MNEQQNSQNHKKISQIQDQMNYMCILNFVTIEHVVPQV